MALMEWQPIETAPKDGGFCLLGSSEWACPWMGEWLSERPPGEHHTHWERHGPRWQRIGFQDINLHPTHWMPLPEPPK